MSYRPIRILCAILIGIWLGHLVVKSISWFFLPDPATFRAGVNGLSLTGRPPRPAGSDRFVDSGVVNPRDAKHHRLFWAERASDGYAVDVLGTPDIFATMFPGYPMAMAEDEGLWDDYFSRTFEVDSFNPVIAKELGPSFIVVYSWLGCLDIYRRYGADYLVIGTSETFRSVLPSLLSDDLPLEDGTKPRVLMCAGAALQLDSAISLAHHLAEMTTPGNQRHPRVLFGYSLSTAFVEGKRNLRNGEEKTEELAEYDLRSARSRAGLFRGFEKYHTISFSDLFPRVTWDNGFPETLTSINDQRDLARQPERAVSASPEHSKGGFVLLSLLQTPFELRHNIESRMKPYYRVYDDFKPENCASERQEKLLQETMTAFAAFASHIYVFVPPTTPLATLAAPDCLRARFSDDLQKLKRDPLVSILDLPWDAFNLDYTDYVRQSRHPDVGVIDIQHVNYFGARKVSQHLATWIRTQEMHLDTARRTPGPRRKTVQNDL